MSDLAARGPINRLVLDDRMPDSPITQVAGNVSVQDRIALSDTELRKQVARTIVLTFIGAKVVVLAGVGCRFTREMAVLEAKLYASADRVVTS